MTKLIAVIGILACITTTGLAQNRANIKGIVVDSVSKDVMEFATVAVLNRKDSSLISYTTTLKTGEFNLHNLPAGVGLKLIISFVGYDNYRKYFTLNKAETVDLGNIKMKSKNGLLAEVKVQGEAVPIIVKKDTIEFSAEAFKTPPNAVVEDLLKRLPGIEVDFNGNITVNGKAVSKLMVDGKQFFANDPRIASKTLDADMISKVQVYDDRDDDPDHLVPDSKVSKIINLKLKYAIKRSTTGKVHGGYGTRDRFDAGLLYSTFRDTLQLSAIIIANNLNRTGFSQGDLSSLGGFNRSGNDNLGYGGLVTGGNSGGIETLGSGGLNINNDYGKKLKINLLYYYSHTSDVYNSRQFNQQFFSDNTLRTLSAPHTDTLSSNSASNSHSVSNKHSISGLVESKPDTNTIIRYQPKLNFNTGSSKSSSNNNSYNNFAGAVNTNNYLTNGNSKQFAFQQSFSYYLKLHKKGESLNISHNLSISSPSNNQNFTDNELNIYYPATSASSLIRLADNAASGSNASLNISYRYPFTKKLTGSLSSNNNFSYNHGRLYTYNFNPGTGLYNVYIDSLSRDLVRKNYNETIRPELTYTISKPKYIRLNAALNVQFMQVYNQFHKNVADINRFETYLLPSFDMSISNLSLSYSQSVSQPSINDMVPYTTVYNLLNSFVGNPDLLPTRNHNLNASYYYNKSESQLSGSLYSYYSFNENSVFRESTYNNQGGSFQKPVNKTGSYNYYISASISKGFKKFNNWQIRVSDRLSDNGSHNFFQVNAQRGFQNSSSISFNQAVYLNYNNKFEINPSYTISPSITSYQDVAYNTVKYVNQNLSVPITVKGIKHYVIESTYSYAYNPLVSAGFRKSSNVLNISFARLFQYRDRAEIRLSVYDLFDQNVSAYRFVSGNYIVDQQTQILQRYFLLTYTWRFVSTVTKK
jgi:hypothetical protein